MMHRTEMVDQEEENGILVFTRMPVDGFDLFFADPETVIATVEYVGFDQEEILSSMDSVADTSQLVQLMESRWSGEEMNFSFEHFWPILMRQFPNDRVLKLIREEGRRSQIFTEFDVIRVLSPSQVERANDGLRGKFLEEMSGASEEEYMLEKLFSALKIFFNHAAKECEFVLISVI